MRPLPHRRTSRRRCDSCGSTRAHSSPCTSTRWETAPWSPRGRRRPLEAENLPRSPQSARIQLGLGKKRSISPDLPNLPVSSWTRPRPRAVFTEAHNPGPRHRTVAVRHATRRPRGGEQNPFSRALDADSTALRLYPTVPRSPSSSRGARKTLHETACTRRGRRLRGAGAGAAMRRDGAAAAATEPRRGRWRPLPPRDRTHTGFESLEVWC